MIVRVSFGWINLAGFGQFVDDAEYDRLLLYVSGSAMPVPLIGDDARRVRALLNAQAEKAATTKVVR